MSEGISYDFDAPFQRKIAALFARDTTFALRVKDLVKPDYFTETSVATLVRIVLDHLKVYNCVPDMKILPTILKDEVAAKKVRKDTIKEVVSLVREVMKADLSNPVFVSDKVVEFSRHQAMEKAIIASVGLLERKEFDKIASSMAEALAVGIVLDGDDYDYFAEIENRTQRREDIVAGKLVKNGITTGYSGMDCYLYHNGWGRKELSCIMGPAKSGKSLSLGDFAKNASLAGYNVLYVSCEVAKEIIAERIDAALSDTLMRDLHKSSAAVDAAIRRMQPGSGHFKMRDYPSGQLKPSQLRRLIEKYRADGIVFDLVCVDYADIMAADHRAEDLRENLRTIYIDLRAIAFDFNLAMLTATQTNREGAKATTGKATDVGDDWNKVRTVDILIGLNATDAEKAAGEARLYWAVSRNTADGFSLRIKQDREKMQFLTKIIGKE